MGPTSASTTATTILKMVPLPGLAAMRCWIYRSSRAYELHHFPWERFALYAVLYKHVLCIAAMRRRWSGSCSCLLGQRCGRSPWLRGTMWGWPSRNLNVGETRAGAAADHGVGWIAGKSAKFSVDFLDAGLGIGEYNAGAAKIMNGGTPWAPLFPPRLRLAWRFGFVRRRCARVACHLVIVRL
jgi:hypothetical protein